MVEDSENEGDAEDSRPASLDNEESLDEDSGEATIKYHRICIPCFEASRKCSGLDSLGNPPCEQCRVRGFPCRFDIVRPKGRKRVDERSEVMSRAARGSIYKQRTRLDAEEVGERTDKVGQRGHARVNNLVESLADGPQVLVPSLVGAHGVASVVWKQEPVSVSGKNEKKKEPENEGNEDAPKGRKRKRRRSSEMDEEEANTERHQGPKIFGQLLPFSSNHVTRRAAIDDLLDAELDHSFTAHFLARDKVETDEKEPAEKEVLPTFVVSGPEEVDYETTNLEPSRIMPPLHSRIWGPDERVALPSNVRCGPVCNGGSFS